MSILPVENLGIAFGGVIAVDGVTLRGPARRDFRHDRPERRRQDHAVQPDLAVSIRRDARTDAVPGEDVTDLPAASAGAARAVAHLPEPADLLPHERARERDGRPPSAREPQCAGALFTCPRCAAQNRRTRAKPRELLALVGLSGMPPTAPAVPYGALKRLEIARALATEPKLLLLDEPAAGCNPVETEEIDAVIQQIAAQGMTVVLVEHDMRLVMSISDRIHVLDRAAHCRRTRRDVRTNPAVIAPISARMDTGGDACSRLTTCQPLRPHRGAAWRLLKVRQGEIVTLVGSNGAGKTTLLRAISGVHPVASGARCAPARTSAPRRGGGSGRQIPLAVDAGQVVRVQLASSPRRAAPRNPHDAPPHPDRGLQLAEHRGVQARGRRGAERMGLAQMAQVDRDAVGQPEGDLAEGPARSAA